MNQSDEGNYARFHLVRSVTVDAPKINEGKGDVEIKIVVEPRGMEYQRGLLCLNYLITCFLNP